MEDMWTLLSAFSWLLPVFCLSWIQERERRREAVECQMERGATPVRIMCLECAAAESI